MHRLEIPKFVRATADSLWVSAACPNALLLVDNISTPLTYSNRDHADRAMSVLSRVLSKNDSAPRSAELFANLLIESVHSPVQLRGAPLARYALQLEQVTHRPTAPAAVFKACVAVLTTLGDDLMAHECGFRALQAGVDSTWHLLRLASIAFRVGDTAAGFRLMQAGVTAARDAPALAELQRHDIPRDPGAGRDVRTLRNLARSVSVRLDSIRPPFYCRTGGEWTLYCVRPDSSLRLVRILPHVFRIWDPTRLAPMAIVTLAMGLDHSPPQDTASHSRSVLDLRFRTLDPVAQAWGDTAFTRSIALPATPVSGSYYSTYFLSPWSTSATAWSLVGVQDGRWHGGGFTDAMEPLLSAGLGVSDIVPGDSAGGVQARLSNGVVIPLLPMGAVLPGRPVHLYYQILSDRPVGGYRVAFALLRGTVEFDAQRPPEIAISASIMISAGLNIFTREIDLSNIPTGAYVLEMDLLDGEGRVVARRFARLTAA